MKVPFVDVAARFRPNRAAFHRALDRVLDHGQAILGPEVAEFENALTEYCGCRHAIAVANCTDALILSLRALKVAGGEVITTPMSYLASTSSIVLAGCKPVFADVGPDLNLDVEAVERAITPATRAILVVHLGGNPARMVELNALAKTHGLKIVEDCAQAFGSKLDGRAVGTWSDAGAASFHPLKNLSAVGDAGAILTSDSDIDAYLRMARNHGHSSRDQCEFWTINSRMDSLQAGFLTAALAVYDDVLERRCAQATKYRGALSGVVQFPTVNPGAFPTYNFFYVVAERRDKLKEYLERNGIDARIHYPIPIHRLNAATAIPRGQLPRADWYTDRILSLPLGPHVSDADIDFVIACTLKFYG